MERHFEVELKSLQEEILEMGALVQRGVELSVEAFQGGKVSEAAGGTTEAIAEVIDRIEPRVNELHRQIDQRAFDLLALQQLVAVDLRFVTSATRIAHDLERMSDRAENIANRVISILSQPNAKSMFEIPRMAEAVQAMLRDVMDAFARRDERLAREILRRDDEVDQYRDVVFQELIDEVKNETRFIQQALDLILVSRNLERIADHATNIAENVVFMVLGEDIRHRAKAQASSSEPRG
jgi:phosphate transport system protein